MRIKVLVLEIDEETKNKKYVSGIVTYNDKGKFVELSCDSTTYGMDKKGKAKVERILKRLGNVAIEEFGIKRFKKKK
jgi:hypothetical protein